MLAMLYLMAWNLLFLEVSMMSTCEKKWMDYQDQWQFRYQKIFHDTKLRLSFRNDHENLTLLENDLACRSNLTVPNSGLMTNSVIELVRRHRKNLNNLFRERAHFYYTFICFRYITVKG